jgi:hypothetical protein
MPVRKADGVMTLESGPLGEDCRLRGVSLRRSGGDVDATTLPRPLPGEPLRNGVSKVAGYLANCWTTI